MIVFAIASYSFVFAIAILVVRVALGDMRPTQRNTTAVTVAASVVLLIVIQLARRRRASMEAALRNAAKPKLVSNVTPSAVADPPASEEPAAKASGPANTDEAVRLSVTQRASTVSRASSSPNFLRRNQAKTSFAKLTTSSREGHGNLLIREDKRVRCLCAFAPAVVHSHLLRLADDRAAIEQPAAWALDAALLFVDISGFTNLCTRLDIDALQHHINSYFTQLIDVVYAFSGDVLRFAGDAIFCAWFVEDTEDELARHEALTIATAAACRCALQLQQQCGTYTIAELGATLTVHSGVGVGRTTSFRVGSLRRWEYFVSGDPVRQVAQAEGLAAKGEAVCSPEAWTYAQAVCEGEPRGTGGNMLLLTAQPASKADVLSLQTRLLNVGLLHRQREKETHLHPSFVREIHEASLRGFAHETIRKAVDGDAIEQVAERRSVVVVFCRIFGLEGALAEGVAGLETVQHCLATATGALRAMGGILRQYILDDKGMVLLWTMGRSAANSGTGERLAASGASRGLLACLSVASALGALGLRTEIGITSGSAFCGLVGAPYRREFSVMGPSVNLAARLMAMCEKQGVELLCDEDIHRQLLSQDTSLEQDLHSCRKVFLFEAYPPMSVKGCALPGSNLCASGFRAFDSHLPSLLCSPGGRDPPLQTWSL